MPSENYLELVAYLKTEKVFMRHLCPCLWASGCSTFVPNVYLDKWGRLEIKLESGAQKHWFDGLFRRVLARFPFVKAAYFWKNDGSCPDILKFNLADVRLPEGAYAYQTHIIPEKKEN